MSRTYRVRHLPRLPGRAKKYTDAQFSKRYQSLGWLWNCGPVANTAAHPWANWTFISRAKAWYKHTGNKRVRHHNKQLLHTLSPEAWDDWEERLLSRNDGWSAWDLY